MEEKEGIVPKGNNDGLSIGNIIDKKSQELKNKKSTTFYVLLLLVNVCTLIVGYVWINTTNKIVSFKVVLDSVSVEILILMVFLFVLILLFGAFSKFLGMYGLCKKKRYGLMLNSEIKELFFDSVTMYSQGWIVGCNNLTNGSMALEYSTNTILMDKTVKGIAKVIFSIIVLVSCGIFCYKRVNTLLFIIGCLVLIVNIFIVMVIALFGKYKDKILSMIASFSGVLYKLRLIKDYEAFYSLICNKLFAMNMFYNQKLTIKISQIFIQFANCVLKALGLYLFMIMLNMGSVSIFAETILKVVLIDLVVSVLPMPKGTLIYEIIFIALFSNLIVDGYLFWGMVLYRLFDLYAIVIPYLVSTIVDKIKIRKIKGKVVNIL